MSSSPVKPVPDGYQSITSFVVLKNVPAFLDFAGRALGAVLNDKCLGPDGTTVMHAELQIGDSRLFLCDEFPGCDMKSPQSLGGSSTSIYLYVENVDAAFERAVAAGCQVKMPLTDMFWGDRYGQLRDPFGFSWGVASHVRDMTPEEIGRAAAEFFAKAGGR